MATKFTIKAGNITINAGTIIDFMCCTALSYSSAWYFNKSMKTIVKLQIAGLILNILLQKYIQPYIDSLLKEDWDNNYKNALGRKSDPTFSNRFARLIQIVRNPASDITAHLKMGYFTLAQVALDLCAMQYFLTQYSHLSNTNPFDSTCKTTVASCALSGLNFASNYYFDCKSIAILSNLLTDGEQEEKDSEISPTFNCFKNILVSVGTRLIFNADYFMYGTSIHTIPSYSVLRGTCIFLKICTSSIVASLIVNMVLPSGEQKKPEQQQSQGAARG